MISPKANPCCFATTRLQFGLGGAAHGCTETFLELVDTTFGVDKLFLTGEEWMRIRCDTHGNYAMFHAIDDFFTVRCFGGRSHDAGTSGHVDENHRLVFGMNVRFHKNYKFHAVPTRGARILRISSKKSSYPEKNR